jgi:hypothetical protein
MKNFSQEESWAHFEQVFDAKLPIREAWKQIIDFHERVRPKPYWDALRKLDVETEQREMKEWLEQLATKSPIPADVLALWIGISKLWDEENAEEVYAIYVQGTDLYSRENLEWIADPIYEPEGGYAALDVLNQTDEIIRSDEEDYTFLDWILPLAYCALTIDEIIRTRLNKKPFLKFNKLLFVTTGHDNGDFKELAPIF